MSNDTKLLCVEDMTQKQDLPAGRFSSWLRIIRNALIKENEVDVPCGECNVCCKSSYFIHIKPEETQTLTRIPKNLLFASPFLPKGNMTLGYDENGHCPMLINNKCSIYEHRPLTCRNYDCRIFPAAGITAGDDDKVMITRHIRRWKFSHPTRRDCNLHSAVQTAALFLQEHKNCFPDGVVPSNTTQLAILAIKVHEVFLKCNKKSGKIDQVSSELEIAKAVMDANEKFKAKRDTLKIYPI